ncbi:uncharacterized protein LOC143361578 [Halictus rubicundus]|uniref:uncharacterized protein LOC143361578 n=1 Tax=Halictus rubicundus TaxID=77578 RepID=UPI0040359624
MSVRFEARDATREEQWMDYHFWQLAALYKKSSCLWKKDARHYLNSERRYRAYQRIQEAMGMPGLTVVGVVLKIREMRRLYLEELKRLLDKELCCNCHEPSISWFYDLHRFLYPYLDYDEAVELRERCHEFRIRGLSGTGTYTCETDSSNESFLTIVSRCLRKLETPLAVKAKMEILGLLRNFMEESKRTVKCRRPRG